VRRQRAPRQLQRRGATRGLRPALARIYIPRSGPRGQAAARQPQRLRGRRQRERRRQAPLGARLPGPRAAPSAAAGRLGRAAAAHGGGRLTRMHSTTTGISARACMHLQDEMRQPAVPSWASRGGAPPATAPRDFRGAGPCLAGHAAGLRPPCSSAASTAETSADAAGTLMSGASRPPPAPAAAARAQQLSAPGWSRLSALSVPW